MSIDSIILTEPKQKQVKGAQQITEITVYQGRVKQQKQKQMTIRYIMHQRK